VIVKATIAVMMMAMSVGVIEIGPILMPARPA